MADEEKVDLTEEEMAERAAKWETYVRQELSSMLDVYLPNSIAGNIGVKYAHPIIETYEDESDPKIDTKVAIGVNININFRFGGPVELPEEE